MGQGQMGQAGQQEAGTRLYVSSESIRNIQQALKERDHDLRVDGKWGPQTSSAVREFQQKEGLEETGQLNLSTLQALGVAEQLGFQEVDTGQQRQRNDGGNRQQGYENRQGDPQQRQQQ